MRRVSSEASNRSGKKELRSDYKQDQCKNEKKGLSIRCSGRGIEIGSERTLQKMSEFSKNKDLFDFSPTLIPTPTPYQFLNFWQRSKDRAIFCVRQSNSFPTYLLL
uniref:Ovule protein n=1 Tax=Ascaris lumbricoides TaxID=6252 RepID=A0A0M3HRL1_ASCLU